MQINNEKILGPFLCKPTSTSMGFWVSFGPELQSLPTVAILISEDNLFQNYTNFTFGSISGDFGVMITEVSGLKPNTRYNYKILINGNGPEMI